LKVDDIVRCNKWVYDGRLGIVIEIQDVEHCQGVYILTSAGIKLVRIENLEPVYEKR